MPKPAAGDASAQWKLVTGKLAAAPLGCVHAFGRFFRKIHLVNFAMKRAAADAEFFGSGGDVAIRRSKRLGNQSPFGLVKIERAGSFTERFSW